MNKPFNPVIYGEVLYDCFPDGRQVLGGAPFNVAWHCQAFGLDPLFISRVGNDPLGEQIEASMKEWGISTRGLQIDELHPTGIVDVSISNGEPLYNIVENSAWDYIDEDQLPELGGTIVLYHGSLALRSSESQKTLGKIKKENSLTVFVDINLRPPWWDISTIRDIIGQSNWLKLNENELGFIIKDTHSLESSMNQLVTDNSLEMLIVTRGEHGAAILVPGSNLIYVAPKMTVNIADTVGAGDAFSSIMLVGQYYNWPVDISIGRAQEFAGEIVGLQGATTNDKTFYQPFIDKWKITN